MKRGRLRVLLGAAPGVGKTYEMLEEGRRLAEDGRDVVIGLLESHGRATTAALAADLPVVPRAIVTHRGVELTELDLGGLLERHPEIALIDELAHTNAPGVRHAKRWQDVADLLDAGIDVITTVNVQHIESLGGVVEQITGVPQGETVPDAVIRGADQVEVIDLSPESLRERLSAGLVYPAERIDAALSNFFRLGNLTALRELALLWLADEVDSALKTYRAEHGIEGAWQARERVVVALTGGSEGETLLRRGARIAARSAGGELLAVHVSNQGDHGGRTGTPGALAAQRALVESLGGTYHQVVGDDVPRALVEFARSANATQLVVGVSRRGRLRTALSGPGIGATVIQESGDIDVHIVTHAEAGGRTPLPRVTGGALSVRRRVMGFVLAVVGGPLLTWLLVSTRNEETITTDVLAYQLLVVLVALVGGIWPAVFAAVMSGLTLNYFFVEPFYTVNIANPRNAWALSLYVVIALIVSFIVDRAARAARAARRSEAEAELLATVAGSVLRGESAVPALISRTRESLALAGVRLVDADGTVVATDGEPVRDGRFDAVTVSRRNGGPPAMLELHGHVLDASERRLIDAVAAQLSAALEHTDLTQTAREAGILAETDQVRTALLSAVSHDLRRPLAAAVAAVGGLRAAGPGLSEDDRAELIATADESLATLSALVTDLLDVSRVQAGVLAVSLQAVDTAGVVVAALGELDGHPGAFELALDPGLDAVRADPVLLQRVLVNVMANAVQHSPAGTRVRVSTSRLGRTAEIRVADHGPGVSAERRDDMFTPFQRLGDTDNTIGLGLGLALSKGFTEGMGGTLTPEDTPGGGLTMVIALPLADQQASGRTPARGSDSGEGS